MPINYNIIENSSSKYKLAHIEFKGRLTLVDYQQFKNIFDDLLHENYFGAIFDLRNATYIPPTLVLEQAKYMSEYETKAKESLIASAILISSTWMQKLLNGLFLFKKPVSPNLVTSSLEDSIEFIHDYSLLKKL